MSLGDAIEQAVQLEVRKTEQQITMRLPRGSNALRNAALNVLANPSPSVPGNPPGVRSGDLRRNWSMYSSGNASGGIMGIQSGMNYSGYLEKGTYKMAARPYVNKIKEAAMPEITRIFGSIGG